MYNYVSNNCELIIVGDGSESKIIAIENRSDCNSPNSLKEDTTSLMVLCRASANPRGYDTIPKRNSVNVNHTGVNEGVQLKK